MIITKTALKVASYLLVFITASDTSCKTGVNPVTVIASLVKLGSSQFIN